MKRLTFVKLGGSLITDKDKAHTALPNTIDLLLHEISKFLDNNPEERILLGHGSGSFGHHAARKFNTCEGVSSGDEWKGFSEVWSEARALNQIVLERISLSGMHPISFPFSSSAHTENHRIMDWNVAPIITTLEKGLLPVVYGDVSFDSHLGGTIVSTEEQFQYLARVLHPNRILLAGLEPGIWLDFPICSHLIPVFERRHYHDLSKSLTGSASIDVTGGMAAKVQSMFSIIEENSTMTTRIFSGVEPGSLLRALNDEPIGTALIA